MRVRGNTIGQVDQVRDSIANKLGHVAALFSEISQLTEGKSSDWFFKQFAYYITMSGTISSASIAYDEENGGSVNLVALPE